MSKPVFYDPQRKRWKRLRRVSDSLALAGIVLGIIFIFGLVRMKPLAGLDLRSTRRNTARSPTRRPSNSKSKEALNRSAHRKTDLKPSDVVLNTGEGLRAAFYVDDDPASYSSLKQHIKQIDLLFPEWLHVVTPDGSITAYTADNRPFAVVDQAGVHGVDHENKVVARHRRRQGRHRNLPAGQQLRPDRRRLRALRRRLPHQRRGARQLRRSRSTVPRRQHQLPRPHARLRGDPRRRPARLPAPSSQSLYADFHARNLRLYVNVPVGDTDFDLKFLAAHSDGLVLMNYDQHQTGSDPDRSPARTGSPTT